MPFEYSHRVRTDELDRLGHANNTRFVQWLQDAALAHAASHGWTWDRHLEMGQGWVVRSHEIEYLGPAFEGDALRIVTWIETLQRATSRRHYRIFRGDRLIARATTLWAFVEYASGVPRRIPEAIRLSLPEEGVAPDAVSS